jgi:hypothetical protein
MTVDTTALDRRRNAYRDDLAAGLFPCLETAIKVRDALVTKPLELRACERRAPARGAVQQNAAGRVELLLVVWRAGVGVEFEHAARRGQRTGDRTVFRALAWLPQVHEKHAWGIERAGHLRGGQVVDRTSGFRDEVLDRGLRCHVFHSRLQ